MHIRVAVDLAVAKGTQIWGVLAKTASNPKRPTQCRRHALFGEGTLAAQIPDNTL